MFTPLGDGDRIEMGRVRLQAIETPGHTPESISIAVYDLERSDTAPHAVLTGDTLFVGDVGRPDLRAALGWKAVDLGGMLYDSLRTKLLALPTRASSTPRTVPGRSAARRSAARRSRQSASSGARTTRCNR
jgi:glyoxylase-like metal-dependent hydrolase (beta-lactamase superfamily II)